MKENIEFTIRNNESEIRLGNELDLRRLSRLCGQVNAFGTNANDEFMIHREDGQTQGIFKTWAVPVIPFIDQGRLDVLENVWEDICTQARLGRTFEEALELLKESPSTAGPAQSAKEVLQNWHERCLSEPARLKESLEKARVTAWVLDRRLVQLFKQEELSSDTAERIGQLTDRLTVAFGLLSPFYNLEALVGDPKGFQWNPIRQAEERLDKNATIPGGKLDLVAQFLPSALSSFVEADKLDWHGLTWDKIKQTTRDILQQGGNSRKALLNAAEASQTSPENILFAANVLEWIPVRVGGKKGDLPQEIASEQISNIKVDGSQSGVAKVVQVGKDINGLIRFMNWLPLVEGEDNFQSGTNWTYASVCDTTSELLNTLATHPEAWGGNFGEVFNHQLLPQLKNLDATSAKGRFLLHLIFEERWLQPQFSCFIDQQPRKDNILSGLVRLRNDEEVRDLGEEVLPRQLVGGKVFGLTELVASIPVEANVPRGIVITTETVENLLKNSPVIWEMILELDRETHIEQMLTIGERIRAAVGSINLTDNLSRRLRLKLQQFSQGTKFAIRSSSTDEDTEEGTGAAGIYESILRVDVDDMDKAVKDCIASVFGEKAIRFRQMNGQGHTPNLAILIQPFIEGRGGTAFTKNFHGQADTCVIDIASSPDVISSGRGNFSEFEVQIGGKIDLVKGKEVVDVQVINQVAQIIESIHGITGRETDMEWVQDRQGRLWVLQVRTLPNQVDEKHVQKEASQRITIEQGQDLIPLMANFAVSTDLIELVLRGERNMDAFQGELFSTIAQIGNRIAQIVHEEDIPLTSHFANICASLGIRLVKGVSND